MTAVRPGIRCLALWLALVAWPSAGVAVTCSVAASGVAFGSYDPFSPLTADAAGQVTVACGPSTTLEALLGFTANYVIALGTGVAASYQPRRLQSGSGLLDYNLFSDAARSILWGDGSGGTQTVDGTLSALLPLGQSVSRDHTVYGRIPAQQNAVPGAYADTVTVTLTF